MKDEKGKKRKRNRACNNGWNMGGFVIINPKLSKRKTKKGSFERERESVCVFLKFIKMDEKSEEGKENMCKRNHACNNGWIIMGTIIISKKREKEKKKKEREKRG